MVTLASHKATDLFHIVVKKIKEIDEMTKAELKSEMKRRSMKGYSRLDLESLKIKLKEEVRSQRTLVMTNVRRRREELTNEEEEESVAVGEKARASTTAENDAKKTRLEILDQVENTLEAQFMCPTCMESFINPVVLNCGHTFCWLCLSQWKKSKGVATCPLCRTVIKNENKALIIDNMIDATMTSLGQEKIAERNDKVAARKVVEVEFKRKEEAARSQNHQQPEVINIRARLHPNYVQAALRAPNPYHLAPIQMRPLPDQAATRSLLDQAATRPLPGPGQGASRYGQRAPMPHVHNPSRGGIRPGFPGRGHFNPSHEAVRYPNQRPPRRPNQNHERRENNPQHYRSHQRHGEEGGRYGGYGGRRDWEMDDRRGGNHYGGGDESRSGHRYGGGGRRDRDGGRRDRDNGGGYY